MYRRRWRSAALKDLPQTGNAPDPGKRFLFSAPAAPPASAWRFPLSPSCPRQKNRFRLPDHTGGLKGLLLLFFPPRRRPPQSPAAFETAGWLFPPFAFDRSPFLLPPCFQAAPSISGTAKNKPGIKSAKAPILTIKAINIQKGGSHLCPESESIFWDWRQQRRPLY